MARTDPHRKSASNLWPKVFHLLTPCTAALPGHRFCVLRRYKLKRGMHTAFVEASRSGGMWDVYTKIGARMV